MDTNATPLPNTSSSTPTPKASHLRARNRSNWKVAAGLIGIGLLFVVIITGVGFALTRNPQLTANLRDVAIIVFATMGLLIMIVLGALMIVLTYYVQSLVVLLRDEIKPVLLNVNQTMNTVRGTTSMVSDTVTKPLVKLASFLAGVQGAQAAFKAKVDNKNK